MRRADARPTHCCQLTAGAVTGLDAAHHAADTRPMIPEVELRKIVASLYVTLDGVIEAPEKWHFPYANDEFMQALEDQVAASDAMLLGRRTYDVFAAYWPHQGSNVTMADQMNNTTKYVVSTTLKSADWKNTTLISGDVAGELTRLKQQPGKNIAITGSATLVWSLLRDNLLDELTLLVHPLVAGGEGKRLFSESDKRTPLTLVEHTKFTTDVLKLTYQPASPR